MPKALDLAGLKVGKITVSRAIGRIGGRTAWECRCECGAAVNAATAQLTGPDRDRLACPDCGGPKPRTPRSRQCLACGTPFLGHGKAKFCSDQCRLTRRRGLRAGVDYMTPIIELCVICGAEFRRDRGRLNVCSPECRREKRRRQTLECWHRRVARDPGRTKELYARRRERAARDPDYAAKMREWERKKYEKHRQRMRDDPDYAARHRRRYAAMYVRDRDRIQAERRAKLDAMGPEELAKWVERMRRYCRDWRRRQMASMTPEQIVEFRDRQREYRRQRRRLAIYLEAQQIEKLAGDARDNDIQP